MVESKFLTFWGHYLNYADYRKIYKVIKNVEDVIFLQKDLDNCWNCDNQMVWNVLSKKKVSQFDLRERTGQI